MLHQLSDELFDAECFCPDWKRIGAVQLPDDAECFELDAYEAGEFYSEPPSVTDADLDAVSEEIDANLWLCSLYLKQNAARPATEAAQAAYDAWRAFHDVLSPETRSAVLIACVLVQMDGGPKVVGFSRCLLDA